MRIVIAEDDPVSRRLLETTLTRWGHDVIVANDGLQAWDILQRDDAPRLAILDWMMPGMDGPQVCRQVRSQGQERYIYILLLTAKRQRQDIVEGMEAGADDYITKPFDSQELRARLRAAGRILDLQSRLLSTHESLRDQATHDSLTGLPNRLLFGDRLADRLEMARRHNRMLAVMFLDVDRFKYINDTFGHNTGDLLLKWVASRLSNLLRKEDMVARMGGDEFTIMLSEINSRCDADQFAQRVLQSFSKPFVLDGQEIFVSASVGVSIFPSDGTDAETLVKNADTAMYRAKENGRGCHQIFVSTLNEKTSRRLELESHLRRALDRDEMIVHYQPRVDLNTGSVLGTEALLRWRRPDVGLLPPAEFVPLAEETGLIIPIGRWVIDAACAQNKSWQEAGLPMMDVAVNISARQFRQENLVETVKKALDETGLDPRYLTLELTESALMHNPDMAADVLGELKAIGVRIAIDDFGTGYSSLNYLKRFPADIVKIDGSFIRDITTDPNDAAIAGAVIAMAHSLKLRVVAEGVETLEQLEFLGSLNCDEIQGYFVSHPVPAEGIEFLLQQRRVSTDRLAA